MLRLVRRVSVCIVSSELPVSRSCSRRLASSAAVAACARPSRFFDPCSRTAASSRLPPSTSPSPASTSTSNFFASSAASAASASYSAASSASMSPESKAKRVLVPVADGTEEMEAVIVVDVLRRAGADVVIASVEGEGGDERKDVTCSRGVRIVADATIGELSSSSPGGDRFDAIVLPGGLPGASNLRDSIALAAILESHRARSEGHEPVILAAICAAPQVVFDQPPSDAILEGKKATAHPAFSSKLRDPSAADARVVVDGDVVTSRGPGTAFEFALAIVEKLYGREKAEEVAGPMVMGVMEPPLVV